MKISVFVGLPSLSTYQLAAQGAEAAAEEDGATDLNVDGPSDPTEANTRTFAENMLQADEPDGYVADPCQTNAWTTVFPKLVSQVPNENVLSFNCAATPEPDETPPPGGTTVVSQSFKETNAVGVEEAIKASELSASTTGTVLYAECTPNSPNQEQSAEASASVIEKLLPNTKIETFLSGLDPNESIQKWTSALNKYSDVVLAAGACSVDTNTLTLLKERHVGGEDWIAAAPEATTAETFEAIANGSIAAGSSTDPWMWGYVATALVIDGARGEPFPEGWVDTEVSTVTKENAAEYQAASESPAAAKKLYLAKAKGILANLEEHTFPLEEYWKYPR